MSSYVQWFYPSTLSQSYLLLMAAYVSTMRKPRFNPPAQHIDMFSPSMRHFWHGYTSVLPHTSSWVSSQNSSGRLRSGGFEGAPTSPRPSWRREDEDSQKIRLKRSGKSLYGRDRPNRDASGFWPLQC